MMLCYKCHIQPVDVLKHKLCITCHRREAYRKELNLKEKPWIELLTYPTIESFEENTEHIVDNIFYDFARAAIILIIPNKDYYSIHAEKIWRMHQMAQADKAIFEVRDINGNWISTQHHFLDNTKVL